MKIKGSKITKEDVVIDIDRTQLSSVLLNILSSKFPTSYKLFHNSYWYQGKLFIEDGWNNHKNEPEYIEYKDELTSDDLWFFQHKETIDFLTKDPI